MTNTITTLTLNCAKLQERKLNLTQGCLLDAMIKISATTRVDRLVIDNKMYFYVTTGKLVEMTPYISEKPNTYRVLLKQLIEKGILDRFEKHNKSYYHITDFASGRFSESMSQGCEKNHTLANGDVKVGKKSRPVDVALGLQNQENEMSRCEKNHDDSIYIYNLVYLDNSLDKIESIVINNNIYAVGLTKLTKLIIEYRNAQLKKRQVYTTGLEDLVAKQFEQCGNDPKRLLDTVFLYINVKKSPHTFRSHDRTLEEYLKRSNGFQVRMHKDFKAFLKKNDFAKAITNRETDSHAKDFLGKIKEGDTILSIDEVLQGA